MRGKIVCERTENGSGTKTERGRKSESLCETDTGGEGGGLWSNGETGGKFLARFFYFPVESCSCHVNIGPSFSLYYMHIAV